ncbi:MAG: hypothetical protein HY923_11535 [Elusimicrobia bacterium]|nr:hypothetical protein [Elusimicrobiota bacterium]
MRGQPQPVQRVEQLERLRHAEIGWLGMKSGKGFYDYASSSPPPNAGVLELLAARK